MKWVLGFLPEFLAGWVLLIPALLLLDRAVFHSLKKTALYYLLACYLAAVYVLVGMPNITYIRLELKLNWIPFLGIPEDGRNSILNVALFVPLGAMLPVLWKSFRSWKKTVGFGFCLSLTIELLQILTLRATDVNDLITNTAGAFLGYLTGSLLLRIGAVRRLAKGGTGEDAYVLCGVVFTVMFALQPFLAAFLTGLLQTA